jgi:hypothetical protein
MAEICPFPYKYRFLMSANISDTRTVNMDEPLPTLQLCPCSPRLLVDIVAPAIVYISESTFVHVCNNILNRQSDRNRCV